MSKKSAIIARCLSVVCLTFILLVTTKRLIRLFHPPEAELNSDAFWTYLPNARSFLGHPWTYLTTEPSSLYVAPLGYIWPALWGANPALTQLANCVLFLLSIVLMWRLTTRLGGLIAGLSATILLTTHPDVLSYIPQVLTESLYLFGFLLFVTASTEYLLAPQRQFAWLTLASLGLSITLLSRPVLQLFTLAAFFLVGSVIIFRHLRQDVFPKRGKNSLIFRYSTLIALSAALALPAATLIKNGIYFQFWGISSGAGAGIYYGVSPFKMGIEPLYGGFEYDAGIIPFTADPSTQAHPLKPRSDAILRQTAIEIVKNTSLADNLKFFTFKLKAWLFFSPEELRMQPKLRKLRTIEWLSIFLALTMIGGAGFLKTSTGRWQWSINKNLLPNDDGKGTIRIGIYFFLLFLALGMAAQLTPVLYNIRYNLFSLDPLLMPLCGISLGILLNHTRKSHILLCGSRNFASRTIHALRWSAPRLIVLAILTYIPSALTKYSIRHSTWSIDPLRPGPTEIVLDNSLFQEPSAEGATKYAENSWITTSNRSSLRLPIVFEKSNVNLNFMDGIWRIKIAVNSPIHDRKCHAVEVKLSMPAKETAYYAPKPAIHVPLNGEMNLHAIRGNGGLRPTGSGDLLLTFQCPAGTAIQWGGAQLLRVTMPESARELIKNGAPINPYRPDDIHQIPHNKSLLPT
jgi:hypothetical protein